MPSETRLPRLAVLIDAENTSHKVADELFLRISTIGDAAVRRVYGDFSAPHLKGWSQVLVKHALSPHHKPACTASKNAADIALVIDAMDLLSSGRCDGFCIVSSDSDFTPLAARIREQGVDVFGFGKRSTPESFQRFCRQFVAIEDLIPAAHKACVSTPLPPHPIPVASAVPIVLEALAKLQAEDGWIDLSRVGKILRSLEPALDVKRFGEKKLSDLLQATGRFELKSHAKTMQVRKKRIAATG
jgi:hypothetical protein